MDWITALLVGLGGGSLGSVSVQLGENYRQGHEFKRDKLARQREAVGRFLADVREYLASCAREDVEQSMENERQWEKERAQGVSQYSWLKVPDPQRRVIVQGIVMKHWDVMYLQLSDSSVKAAASELRSVVVDPEKPLFRDNSIDHDVTGQDESDFEKKLKALADAASTALNP
jgi:hypothetical protein